MASDIEIARAARESWYQPPKYDEAPSTRLTIELPGYDVGGTRVLFAPDDTFIVLVVVVAQWGLGTANALGGGMFNFDTLWYHMPFAAEYAQSGSVTAIHFTQAVRQPSMSARQQSTKKM